jgi:hypothetical protein
VSDRQAGARPPEPAGFEPPPYPYDRLADLHKVADTCDGGAVDL